MANCATSPMASEMILAFMAVFNRAHDAASPSVPILAAPRLVATANSALLTIKKIPAGANLIIPPSKVNSDCSANLIAAIYPSLSVRLFETSYHACANSFTISTEAGLMNAFSHMLFARSIIPAAVSCWMLYSAVTAVASRKAMEEVSRCCLSMGNCSDMVTRVAFSRWPSEPRSLKIPPSALIPPFSRIFSKTRSMASIIFPD